MNSEKIVEQFHIQKKTTANSVKQLYKQIEEYSNSQVQNKNSAMFLAKKESELLYSFTTELIEDTKSCAISVMISAGIPEYLTETVWNSVFKAAGVPKYVLCQVMESAGTHAAPQVSSDTIGDSKLRGETPQTLRRRRNFSSGVAASGIVCTVIGLMVPGWNASEIALCSVGSAMIIIGGTSAVVNEMKLREEESKLLRHRAENAVPHNNFTDVIHKICTTQYQTNTTIFANWIDAVMDATVEQCKSRTQ